MSIIDDVVGVLMVGDADVDAAATGSKPIPDCRYERLR
jgi:hypothetical protein